MLEQGPTEKTIIEQCVRNRMPLPQAIANAPLLEIGLDLFYVAFMDLTSCRGIGMSEGPIPWTAMCDYANEMGLVDEQREDFFILIRDMDTTYLNYRASKAKHDSAAKPPPKGSRKAR